MTENNDVELDYAYLSQQAMRGVVKKVLSITEELGNVPGEHHFYVEFMTTAPGVEVSDDLLGAYPERMTIVLQHKFENLLVADDHFEVTLHFKGLPDRLVIPFEAITNFVDPSCDVALRFDADLDAAPPEEDTEEMPAEEDASQDEATDANGNEETSTAEVVSLDSFRKK